MANDETQLKNETAEGLPSAMIRNSDQYANDEYKVGHNKPPLFLVVLYVLVLVWCAISWIPFYGY